MAFLSSINVVASGLTAQQLRLDVVSENITNATTTRTENGGAYRRKMVTFEAIPEQETFREVLARTAGTGSNEYRGNGGGVRVAQITEDPSDMKMIYADPSGCKCGRICGNAQCGYDQGNGRCDGCNTGIFRQYYSS